MNTGRIAIAAALVAISGPFCGSKFVIRSEDRYEFEMKQLARGKPGERAYRSRASSRGKANHRGSWAGDGVDAISETRQQRRCRERAERKAVK